MNTFWAFLEKTCHQNFEILSSFFANIGKMVIEIIRRNVTTNMLVFILPGTGKINTSILVVTFPTTFLGVICVECMNITEIYIFSLFDNTRYFIP